MSIDFFDTSFYDKESAGYSDKRYKKAPVTFIQFSFQERLRRVIHLVGKYAPHKDNQALLEDGCADGVVAYAVDKKYPELFSKIIGTDISPGMIREAEKQKPSDKFSFFVKDELEENVHADMFLAIGFVSPGIFNEEFAFIKKHLSTHGHAIVSLVSRNSPYARLKLKDREVTSDYWTFKKYEEYLKKEYEIVDAVPYGLFVPKLWVFPKLARIVQPVLEKLFRFAPSLFHETLYVIKEKRQFVFEES